MLLWLILQASFSFTYTKTQKRGTDDEPFLSAGFPSGRHVVTDITSNSHHLWLMRGRKSDEKSIITTEPSRQHENQEPFTLFFWKGKNEKILSWYSTFHQAIALFHTSCNGTYEILQKCCLLMVCMHFSKWQVTSLYFMWQWYGQE